MLNHLSRIGLCLIVAGLLVTVSSGQESESTWPQWRGPDRDGVADSSAWPDTLDDSKIERQWRVELGPSYSGPLVIGDRVYTTETKDKKFEIVSAFDRATGEKVWETSWEGSMKVPFFANRNGSWIRSTPTYSDGRLYVAGIRDYFVCLDAENGDELWKVDFVNDLKGALPDFGCVCSPLVDGEFVFIQAGGAFYKLNKDSGEVIWKTAGDGGGMYGSAFSSPLIAELAGKRQMLVQTRQELKGIDIESGKQLWAKQIPSFRGMNILTPTVKDNMVFTSAYQNKSHMFEISENGGAFTATEKWNHNKPAYMSTPIVMGDHIFMHHQRGRFVCLNAQSGDEKWISKPEGEYASLVAGEDRFLALRSDGELMMIKANPNEFEELGSVKLTDQESWAHLAVCENDLVVREQNALSLFKWQDANEE